jgi:hypothetical protein
MLRDARLQCENGSSGEGPYVGIFLERESGAPPSSSDQQTSVFSGYDGSLNFLEYRV